MNTNLPTNLPPTSKTLSNLPINSQGKPTGLAARIAAAKQQQAATDPNTMPNRIALMEDCSGSMSGKNLTNLKIAVRSFLQNCNFQDTSVCHRTFGKASELKLPLTCDQALLLITIESLSADGGTYLDTCMKDTLSEIPLTRGVIISDGCPSYPEACYKTAEQYRDHQVPLDCVHIGDDFQGTIVLQKIAEITGGLYIKFTDPSQFSQTFHYLTPGNRDMLLLASPDDRQKILGSDK